MIHYLAGPNQLTKLTEWGSGLGEREGDCWRPRLGLWAWRGWCELYTGAGLYSYNCYGCSELASDVLDEVPALRISQDGTEAYIGFGWG